MLHMISQASTDANSSILRLLMSFVGKGATIMRIPKNILNMVQKGNSGDIYQTPEPGLRRSFSYTLFLLLRKSGRY